MEDDTFMKRALELAQIAGDMGEVPVGCVIVRRGQIVGEGYNRRETDKNALMHAEIMAIDSACRAVDSWRLHECDLYVTLEPCPMCAGAIINSRMKSVFYGAGDSKCGACGGVINLFEEAFNHKPRLQGGILKQECAELLSDFFKELRL